MSFASLFSITPTPESGGLFSNGLTIENLGDCKPLTVRQLARLRDEAYQTEIRRARTAKVSADQLSAVMVHVHDRFAKYFWQEFYLYVDGDPELFAKAMHLSRTGGLDFTKWHETGDLLTGENRHECNRVLQASFIVTPIPEETEGDTENPPEPAAAPNG